MEKTELTNAQNQNRVRQRISQASIDPDKYEYIPAKEQNDHVKADQYQQVAIYARVSTDNPMQTTSFELQQKYYEELVAQHPQWVLVKIYADEGKSGTTMQHRDGFNEMLADANAGKIDLSIVKNISRFARNVVDCLSIIRKLSEKKIGVLFESEAIYSLNDDSHMALSFQATIAEQESRTRSRSMETSLRMRLDHGRQARCQPGDLQDPEAHVLYVPVRIFHPADRRHPHEAEQADVSGESEVDGIRCGSQYAERALLRRCADPQAVHQVCGRCSRPEVLQEPGRKAPESLPG